MVRTRFGWLASLATAVLGVVLPAAAARAQEGNNSFEVPPLAGRMPAGICAPAPAIDAATAGYIARGQSPNGYYEVPPPENIVPSPFGHPRYESGGLYFYGGFKYFMTTNPLKQQVLARRGFFDNDGSIGTALGLPGPNLPGQFIGSGAPALLTDWASGPLTFVPGFDIGIGWRFENGVAVEIGWMHLFDARYSASAGPTQAPNAFPGANLENTFITAPVFNWTTQFNGPANQVGIGNAGATFGIWNAASNMQIDFVQRFDQYQLNVRYPLQQTDCYRLYGLFGPRLVWFWERFNWRTVDQNVNNLAGTTDQANYSNVVSNRLWGVHCGLGNEWLIGVSPIGAFSVSLDVEGAIFADFVDASARYVLGDFSTGSYRHRNFQTIVPEVSGSLNLWWYPYEGIQVRLGYDAMVFFNTMASPKPVDFNFGSVDPGFERNILRSVYGLTFSAGWVF